MFELSKSENAHYILGAVLIPNRIDSDQDIVDCLEIEKACARFNVQRGELWKDHKSKMNPRDAEIIESYVTPIPMKLGGQEIPAGTWLIKCRISKELYESAGSINGFSIKGTAKVRGKL